MLLPSASITATLDVLERRGWIQRIPNPHDRRSLLIEITADGRTVADQMLPGIRLLERRALSVLTKAERTQLLAMLAKVLARTSETRGRAHRRALRAPEPPDPTHLTPSPVTPSTAESSGSHPYSDRAPAACDRASSRGTGRTSTVDRGRVRSPSPPLAVNSMVDSWPRPVAPIQGTGLALLVGLTTPEWPQSRSLPRSQHNRRVPRATNRLPRWQRTRRQARSAPGPRTTTNERATGAWSRSLPLPWFAGRLTQRRPACAWRLPLAKTPYHKGIGGGILEHAGASSTRDRSCLASGYRNAD